MAFSYSFCAFFRTNFPANFFVKNLVQLLARLAPLGMLWGHMKRLLGTLIL